MSILSLSEDSKIIHLSPFPRYQQSGGAIRSREIFNAFSKKYKNSFIMYCPEINPDILKIPYFINVDHSQVEDITMLFKVFNSERYIDGDPDAIVFDHPWLWTEVRELKNKFPKIKIIHSSHNIENIAKVKLLDGIDFHIKNKIIRYIESIEKEIAKRSDLIICSTDKDKKWFETNGAKNIIVVKNGTNFKQKGIRNNLNYGIVVGSGHPPNISGAKKYLNGLDSWIINDSKIIISGSMGDSLNYLSYKNIIITGMVDDDTLNELISSANVVILPIEYGGGSNLKTAEALVSGRPIVSTSVAFRGFEDMSDLENISISNDVNDFRNNINKYLENKVETVNREKADDLLWKNTTSIILDMM